MEFDEICSTSRWIKQDLIDDNISSFRRFCQASPDLKAVKIAAVATLDGSGFQLIDPAGFQRLMQQNFNAVEQRWQGLYRRDCIACSFQLIMRSHGN